MQQISKKLKWYSKEIQEIKYKVSKVKVPQNSLKIMQIFNELFRFFSLYSFPCHRNKSFTHRITLLNYFPYFLYEIQKHKNEFSGVSQFELSPFFEQIMLL